MVRERSNNSLRRAIATLFAVLAIGTSSAYAITIDMLPVGDVGNAASTRDQRGAVNYAYSIGKFEVTIGQYTAFLNAVAVDDTYGLYNSSMASLLYTSAGIARSGSAGSYSYSVIGSPNHPVTYVSWGDAARFTNWLHNGQPNGGQNTSTTEDGAYALNGATTTAALMAVDRRPNAEWFIPSEDEWYKAAYYQPAAAGGDVDSYWNFPTRTDISLYSDQPPGATPDNTRVANIPLNDGLANGYDDGYATTGASALVSGQDYLTDVGAYYLTSSYYGTFDQAGNVFEMLESRFHSLPRRGMRGGSWLNALTQGLSVLEPLEEAISVGFRVASAVPEPSTLLLVALAGAISSAIRCRRRRQEVASCRHSQASQHTVRTIAGKTLKLQLCTNNS